MTPKTPQELESIRACGAILRQLFADLRQHVQPGMSEREIDNWMAEQIRAAGAEATYRTAEVNFPGVVCISVNEQITHSIPTDYCLQKGDVVGFDMVISYQGMKTDSAFTMVVGEAPTGAVKHLLQTTERALYAGIDAIRGEGTVIGDISAAIQAELDSGKLGIIRELVGHGIGHKMHEPPEIPNFGVRGKGQMLRAGMTIAIEPLACLGKGSMYTEEDGWSLSTRDGSLAAQFEHTVLITDKGAEILT